MQKSSNKRKKKNEPLLSANGLTFKEAVSKLVNTPPMKKAKAGK